MRRRWGRPGERGQLGRAARGRLDGVDQAHPNTAPFQGMETGDRRAARRGHLILEHAGMLARVPYHHRGAQYGLSGQERGDVARQADADPAVAEASTIR